MTVLRDAIGYGFYFKSYEEMRNRLGLGVLLAGGIAGCISWASIYPLDVIKTRVQVQDNTVLDGERRGLLDAGRRTVRRLGAWECARKAYFEEGASVFFRGLGVW